LAVGTDGKVLMASSTATYGVTWSTLPATSLTGGQTNYIAKWSSATAISTTTIFDNSGNIVIGSTTASSLFTVATSTDIFNIANSGIASFSYYLGVGTTTPATIFQVYGTSTFKGGQVGIATTTPAYDLDVYGAIRGKTAIILGNGISLSSSTLSINLINATNTVEAMFKKPNAYTITKVSCNSINGTTTFNLVERTEVAPNTGGTVVLTSSLVCGISATASSSAFSNSGIAAAVPVVASTTAVVASSTSGVYSTVNTYIYVDYYY